jgi:2-methylcitrate dehydratase PrpD
MTKPLHAGKAAMNGLIAAQIAAKGFTAGQDAIECAQGFMDVTAPGFKARHFSPGGNKPMEVENNLFKYHASCYLTHSTIEAVSALRAQHGIGLDDLKELKLFMPATHKLVCDIPDPQSGLEIKFSIRHLAIMALDGANTAALDMYTDENARDAKYADGRAKITVVEKQLSGKHAGAVSIETTDGRTMVGEVDVGKPATDVDAQWQKLEHKARTIMTPSIGEARTDAIVAAVAGLGEAHSLDDLMTALA